ncbi:hypothetical protein SDC9_63357 [bioreactor metagenome]|uniref:Uncharacterized protein n=1 Tax=bioreactor metagenome TaxID=1076179 RepID=A0A644XLB6_9ZZZZ
MVDINYNSILNTKDLHVHEEMFAPIFYLKNYPLQHTKYSSEELKDYQYINGLKVAASEFFNDPNKAQRALSNYLFAGRIEQYASDLKSVINSVTNDKIILSSIPSSKTGKKNIVTCIVESLTNNYSEQFINGNSLFQKIRDENTAHESSESSNRDYRNHYNSWSHDLPTDPNDLNKTILVIDDVLTTGSTFYAAYKHLTNLGYSRIVYLAFGRTISNTLLRPYPTWNRQQIQRKDSGVDAIIFDLDQTIIDSRCYKELDFESESYLRLPEIRKHYKENQLFKTYRKIDEIFLHCLEQKQIPLMIVTNRSKSVAQLFVELNSKKLFGYHFKTPINPCLEAQPFVIDLNNGKKQKIVDFQKNGAKTAEGKDYVDVTEMPILLSYSDAEVSDGCGSSNNYHKPSDYLILKAKKIFEDIYERKDIRIIGVGNTEYDIMAYNKAGIESVLVNWGNLGKIKNTFNADYVFEDVESFTDFVMRQ